MEISGLVGEAAGLWELTQKLLTCHRYNPAGKIIGHIHTPERCANVAFGGEMYNRLFMACGHSIYAVYVNTQGAENVERPKSEVLQPNTYPCVVLSERSEMNACVAGSVAVSDEDDCLTISSGPSCNVHGGDGRLGPNKFLEV